MKSHIMNLAVLMTISGCASSQPSSSFHQPIVVFSRDQRLEALGERAKTPVVLRQKFGTEEGISLLWQMSRDGRQLTFCATPGDEDFFDAGAYRDYLFLAPFNGKAHVFLAGYGPKSVDKGACYDYASSSFDGGGQKILMCEGQVGQFMDDSSPQWIAMYDVRTRRRVFDSRRLIAQLPHNALQKQLASQRYSSPALSPDGNDIVCIALPDDGDSIAEDYAPGQKVPSFSLVHFDLKKQTAEILASIDDQLAFGRTTHTDTPTSSHTDTESAERDFTPQFAWHPTQKSFLFSGPATPTTQGRNLFNFDLATKKMTRLTAGAQNDFSPQWSPDGQFVWWLRGAAQLTQIIRAQADGTNAKVMFPTVRGAEKIQIVDKLGDWSRYKKIPIRSLAGIDK